MRKSLKRRIMLMVIIFVIVINIGFIFFNYRNFASIKEQFSFSTASTVAETCALVIDRDSIGNYPDTLQRDTAYYATWNKLIDYRNTNSNIVKLSLVYFTEDGYKYIFDTDLTENGAFLGDHKGYDYKQIQYKDDLISGDDIGFINYDDHMDVYMPVLSSYNIPVGYVVVGISTAEAEKGQQLYLMKTIIILTLLTLLMTVLFMKSINIQVIRPINLLSEAASNYPKTIDKDTNISALGRLKIKTGDEIEHLSNSLKKMESDILNSANSLVIATWNSNHDSMTQLFNKRYFKESLEQYEQMDSIGMVYCDVNNLKIMNDTYGHESGDEVIEQAAKFLTKYADNTAHCYRMGGDEFLMVICNCTQEYLKDLVSKMKADSDVFIKSPNNAVECYLAIGSSFASGDFDVEAVVIEADVDMYVDKISHR